MQENVARDVPLMFMRSSHDYMMRSEKRPGQSAGGMPPRRRRRKPKRHPVYAVITLLLLVLAYPIGLILLWVRKLNWSAVTKLLVSVVTGVLFFVLMAFALTFETDNPVITAAQTSVKSGLTNVMDTAREAVSDKEQIEYNLIEGGPKIFKTGAVTILDLAAKEVPIMEENIHSMGPALRDLNVSLVSFADRNIREIMYRTNIIPRPDPTPTPVPTATPEPTATPSPAPTPTADPQVSPAASVAAPAVRDELPDPKSPLSGNSAENSLSDSTVAFGDIKSASENETASGGDVSPEPAESAQAIPTLSALPSMSLSPASNVMNLNNAITPTVAPVVSPEPVITPSPTPIVLPEAKSFGDVKVYYFDGSRSYHFSSTCGSMKNAPEHTLTEAGTTGKTACGLCNPPSIDLLDTEIAVWCGTDNVFHIDGECQALTEEWTGKSFEEAWLEDGMIGCPLCGADLYVEKHMIAHPTPAPAPAIQP